MNKELNLNGIDEYYYQADDKLTKDILNALISLENNTGKAISNLELQVSDDGVVSIDFKIQ